MPAVCRSHPGRPCAHKAKTGRMMNMPNRRSPKIAASDRLACSSRELMRAGEFTEMGAWSEEEEGPPILPQLAPAAREISPERRAVDLHQPELLARPDRVLHDDRPRAPERPQ